MVSGVTGSEVDPDVVGPYYWVRNLISPVMFADAVKEMVAPAEGEEGKNAVDLLIEVGPHSVLGGPLEQILEHNGIRNVGIMSMLQRGQNAVETCMALAADLFRSGVPIDVAKVNGDAQVHLLTDLPPYAWNHSKSHRADSRKHQELLAQEYPTRGILG